MGRNRTVLRVLAAIVLVAVMAVLPILTAAWQDRGTLGKPSLREIRNVELVFEKGIPGLGLLSLMNDWGTWQLIDASAASMTQQEAEQAAEDAIAAYRDAGLIPQELFFEVRSAETRVLSNPSGLTAIVWSMVLISEKNGFHFGEVNLELEDSSGRVMHINFGSENRIPAEDMPWVLREFSELYFAQLDIEEYQEAQAVDLEGVYVGDSATAQRYRFATAEYGEVFVDLYVFTNGFYSSFFR